MTISPSPKPKRLNLSATPERFKLDGSQKSQPCLSKGPGPAPSSTSSGAQHASSALAWSLRALFLPAQPLQPSGQLAGFDDDELGPLTQIAAAGAEPLARAFCPHCGCFLSDVGQTEDERRSHVDTCQSTEPPCASDDDQNAAAAVVGDDAGSDGHSEAGEQGLEDEQPEEEEGPPEDAQLEAGGVEEEEEMHAIAIENNEEDEELPNHREQQSIQLWLAARGLQKYADCFVRAGAELSLLPFLTDQDLRQMGILALGARKKILLGAAELAAGPASDADGGDANTVAEVGQHRNCFSDELAAGNRGLTVAATRGGSYGAAAAAAVEGAGAGGSASGGSMVEWRALSGTGGTTLFCGNIRRYFQPDPCKPPPPQQQPPASGILQYFQPKGGGTIKHAKPAAAAAATAGDRGPGPADAFTSGTAAGGQGRGRIKQPQWAHKAAQGDAAGGRAGQRFGGGGRGPTQAIPLKPWHLVPGTSFVVDRFNSLPPGLPNKHWFLTHFHADHYKGLSSKFDRGTLHCSPPTARLVQQQLRVATQRIRPHPLNQPFEVEGVRVTFLNANHCPGAVMVLFEPPGAARPVLHTGDCRLVPAMQEEPALQAVRGKCDLILDTTYCSPEYAFPTQAEVLQFSIDAVKAEAFNPKTLFLFGSYTIGKERLFLEAARVLQRKVYVSASKRKVLDCLDLPPEYSGLLTTNDVETNLHAVPLWMVTQKHMAKILKHYRGRFTNVVGFQPTGWTHQRDMNKTRARGRRQQKGTVITYQVPYSEHSSFTELKDFVAWLNPVRIIPHVNTDNGGPKATRMVRLLRGQDAA